MIVDTMTYKEMVTAVSKMTSRHKDRFKKIVSHHLNDYKRIIFKGNKQRYDFKPLRVVADGIDFYLCPFSLGKSLYKKHGIIFRCFAKFFYRGTYWYCVYSFDGKPNELYQQHVFKRFIERHLKDNSKVSSETVRKFLKETEGPYAYGPIASPKHPNGYYIATRIGVLCGYKYNENTVVWLTFIDKESISKGYKKQALDELECFINTRGLNDDIEYQKALEIELERRASRPTA